MLSKDEELRLASCIDVAKFAVNGPDGPDGYNSSLANKTILWLATKLKEINSEAAMYSQELQRVNEEFANYVEQHE